LYSAQDRCIGSWYVLNTIEILVSLDEGITAITIEIFVVPVEEDILGFTIEILVVPLNRRRHLWHYHRKLLRQT
jgi:hypothetical protein